MMLHEICEGCQNPSHCLRHGVCGWLPSQPRLEASDEDWQEWLQQVRMNHQLCVATGEALDDLADLHKCKPRKSYWIILESDASFRNRLIAHVKKNEATPKRVQGS